MAGVLKKSFDSPDEQRRPDKTQVNVVDLGAGQSGEDDLAARLALVGMHQAHRRHR